MHASVLEWLDATVQLWQLDGGRIIEVGSYNVNGTARSVFSKNLVQVPDRYVGVDLRAGPGVDVVVDVDNPLPFADGDFDLAICTETLEHDARPWRTVHEIGRVIRPGGIALITARGFGFPFHSHPVDYWRFSVIAMEVLLNDAGLAMLGASADYPDSPGVMCVARKPDGIGP